MLGEPGTDGTRMQDASRMRSESSEHVKEDGSRRKCKLMKENQENECSGRMFEGAPRHEVSEGRT